MRQAIHHIGQQLSGHFEQHIEIKNARQVFGGDINQTFELQTNTGFILFEAT
jgi:fructosamine-3-kinase